MTDKRDNPVYYTAVFKDAGRYDRKDRVIELMNTKGQSKTAMVNRIFEAGLPIVEKEVFGKEKAEKISSVDKEVKRIARKKELIEKLSVIYEDMGADVFIGWCKEDGQIDDDIMHEFLARYTWRAEEIKWPQRARSWLHEYHFDGKPYRTAQVKQDAIEVGIITESPDDWAKLRAIASRMGLTKTGHGIWQLEKK